MKMSQGGNPRIFGCVTRVSTEALRDLIGYLAAMPVVKCHLH